MEHGRAPDTFLCMGARIFHAHSDARIRTRLRTGTRSLSYPVVVWKLCVGGSRISCDQIFVCPFAS